MLNNGFLDIIYQSDIFNDTPLTDYILTCHLQKTILPHLIQLLNCVRENLFIILIFFESCHVFLKVPYSIYVERFSFFFIMLEHLVKRKLDFRFKGFAKTASYYTNNVSEKSSNNSYHYS